MTIPPAQVFRALGDEQRLEMLAFVAAGEGPGGDDGPGVCGCHIQERVGLAQATVSHHMKLLVDAGLVSAERRGKWVYYQLRGAGFAQALALLRERLDAARAGPGARGKNAPAKNAQGPRGRERRSETRAAARRTAGA